MSARLAEAVRTALARPEGGAFDALLRAPTVTAIVADPADTAALAVVVPELLGAMQRAGVPRGRAYVLLACAGSRTPAAGLRAALRVPVIAHDPATSACYTAGVTPGGTPIEIDDELREAEAVIVAGSLPAGGDVEARLESLLFPGLASLAAAAAHASRTPVSRAEESRIAAGRIGVDLALVWDETGERARALAGALADVAAAW